MAVGDGQVSEPTKQEEIVHPRTDFREAMKAAGATDAEIKALMLAHVRIDGWAMLGFCWVTLIGSTAFRGVSAKDYGLSDHWNIIMSVVPMWVPIFCLGFLIRRAARHWIAPHESRLDCFIIPSIRCRTSENTYEEYFYAWVALWIVLAILLSLTKVTQLRFHFRDRDSLHTNHLVDHQAENWLRAHICTCKVG